MKNVFIDTNIWLSLYHFTNDDLSQFEKLKDMLGISINLIVPEQVRAEIIRNRESKVLDALKSFDIKAPKYPAFCKGYEEYEQLSKDVLLIAKRFNAFRKKIESDITSQELPADKTLQSFFSIIELVPCEPYIQNAYNRYRIGNPPGKDNKYGDAINWECVLDIVPEKEDLYFISADKDYRSLVSEQNMNPFLVDEWTKKKHSDIHFYSTLVGFLNEHVEEIKLQDEIEKQKLIDDLCDSGSFQITHGIIASLKRYTGWTESDIEKLCTALVENTQVLWIIDDPDIYEFYQSVLAGIKYDDLNECNTKAGIDIIIDKQHEIEQRARSDYEADRDDALEEYFKH